VRFIGAEAVASRKKGDLMKEVTPQEAFELMKDDPEWIYLDVRSVQEFEAGHPMRAINIPLMHFIPGAGMVPNEDFSAVVEANLPKGAKILVGCKTGGRSARACQLLAQMGYSNIANVRGGFLGVVDNSGRVVEPGWSLLSLPLCETCGPESSYQALAARAKK
jgi:rhodanese-related sulfurtransferase